MLLFIVVFNVKRGGHGIYDEYLVRINVLRYVRRGVTRTHLDYVSVLCVKLDSALSSAARNGSKALCRYSAALISCLVLKRCHARIRIGCGKRYVHTLRLVNTKGKCAERLFKEGSVIADVKSCGCRIIKLDIADGDRTRHVLATLKIYGLGKNSLFSGDRQLIRPIVSRKVVRVADLVSVRCHDIRSILIPSLSLAVSVKGRSLCRLKIRNGKCEGLFAIFILVVGLFSDGNDNTADLADGIGEGDLSVCINRSTDIVSTDTVKILAAAVGGLCSNVYLILFGSVCKLIV